MKFSNIPTLSDRRCKEITVLASLKRCAVRYKTDSAKTRYYLTHVEDLVEKLTSLFVEGDYVALTGNLVRYDANILLGSTDKGPSIRLFLTCPLEVDVALFQGSVMALWQTSKISTGQMYISQGRVCAIQTLRSGRSNWFDRTFNA